MCIQRIHVLHVLAVGVSLGDIWSQIPYADMLIPRVTGPWLSGTHGRSNLCILLKTEPTQQRNFERTQQHPCQNGTTYEASNLLLASL